LTQLHDGVEFLTAPPPAWELLPSLFGTDPVLYSHLDTASAAYLLEELNESFDDMFCRCTFPKTFPGSSGPDNAFLPLTRFVHWICYRAGMLLCRSYDGNDLGDLSRYLLATARYGDDDNDYKPSERLTVTYDDTPHGPSVNSSIQWYETATPSTNKDIDYGDRLVDWCYKFDYVVSTFECYDRRIPDLMAMRLARKVLLRCAVSTIEYNSGIEYCQRSAYAARPYTLSTLALWIKSEFSKFLY
jgi:hypothetical protein